MADAKRNKRAFSAPAPRQDWALFLDIDGTLIDLAPTPESVVVPDTLAGSLTAARSWLGGALAIVSGRTLPKIDELMSYLKLPCAAEHGAVVRLPDGEIKIQGPCCAVPDTWRKQVLAATQNWLDVIVECKPYSIAIHFRRAPDRERDVLKLLEALIAGSSAFEVLSARMAYEIRQRGVTKGAAVREFMKQAPFLGRAPVFVGDDVTDEDGFRAAREMGGLALHVNEVFGGAPSNVRQWLREFRSAEPS